MSVKILNENLKNNSFGNLYYIFGEEEYLKNYYIDELKKKIVTTLPEFNITIFDGNNFDYLDFCNAVNNYPMMSDKKVVIVNDFDNSVLKKDFTKEFTAFLKGISEFCVVIFYDSVLKTNSTSNSLEKVINAVGGLSVNVKKPDASSLVNWSLRHFKSYGKTISKDDIYYLIDITDNDMLSLDNEISKICNYSKEDVITKEIIDKLVTRSIDANRFEIADAFAKKNYGKIIDIVEKLYKQNIDDILIANIFYRAFTDMWKAKLAVKNGKPTAVLSSDFKINPYAANKISANAKTVSLKFLEQVLFSCLKLDIALKTTETSSKVLMTTFIAEIIDKRKIDG